MYQRLCNQSILIKMTSYLYFYAGKTLQHNSPSTDHNHINRLLHFVPNIKLRLYPFFRFTVHIYQVSLTTQVPFFSIQNEHTASIIFTQKAYKSDPSWMCSTTKLALLAFLTVTEHQHVQAFKCISLTFPARKPNFFFLTHVTHCHLKKKNPKIKLHYISVSGTTVIYNSSI